MTLVGRELAWGPRRSPPEIQGFWEINNCQMSMILYHNCDTGRSRICVGSRGGAPRNSGVLGNKLLSDEHAFYTLFGDNGRVANWRGVQGAEPQEAQGFWAINNCQMSMLLYLIW